MSLFKDTLVKITLWIIGILTLFKSINFNKWIFVESLPFWNSSYWSFFVEQTHWFWIGWALFSIIMYRGIPSSKKFISFIKPKQ